MYLLPLVYVVIIKTAGVFLYQPVYLTQDGDITSDE